ncbi:ferrochelatase [Edaphobacter acidisoli]|uniref:Ferrochelatase n=1 Tax=Edaphobacter acidisoli TaxID=2040573 RepID=A0A916RVR3_9BACT|nr:ferrochelatase [Edaphobacter acidisoli]GGA73040.1 ferrochelatase [Edaphobacter acidisoli]
MSEAVLLLAHGTPNALGEMAEYLDKVTGGRAIPREVVEELQHRYRLIGLREEAGATPPPLTHWTLEQARLLERNFLANGLKTKVYVAMRNWHPYIADVIAQMRRDGVTQFRAVCLAPQNSRTSVGLYRKATLAAAEGIEVEFIAGWAEHPVLAEAFAEKLRKVWRPACDEAGRKVPVLFTAHSVPCRTVMGDSPDPYPVEAKATARLVAERMAGDGLTGLDCYFAFQSQGVSGGPWIGPTVEDTLKALREEGHAGVVIQPVGFLCDHVEILYDIDIAFKELAAKIGLELWRAESLNDSPLLIDALADVATGRYRAGVVETVAAAGV